MIYLDAKQLEDAFVADEKEMKVLWRPFDELERLAANKIRTDLPANFPRVNDGSLSAFLQEMPMRVIAQLQTGKAKAMDRDEQWVGELASIIWANIIVPNANTQAPFLNKQQIALYRAGIYGSCPMFGFFSVRDGYTGGDFSIPYIRDVVWEKRKHSDLDSDRAWLTTYYSEQQIKAMLKRAAGDKSGENKWNPNILQKVLDAGPEERDNAVKNQNERDTSIATGGYRLITCFQKGDGAPFMTVAPTVGYKVAREVINKNPTGDIPLINQYCYENLENPLGRGLIEQAGPTQNVLDFVTQAHMFATQIGLQPPIEIAGETSKLVESSLVYSPSKKWRVGDARITIKDTVTQIYQRFPEVYGLYKTQLMNILGYNDNSVSSEAGNVGYSKTPASTKQNQARTSAHDNYYRKRSDEAHARLARIVLNLHMANMEGQDVLKLMENDIVRLRNAGIDIPEDDNQLEIEWDQLRAKFDFNVDENSSKGQEDQETVEKLSTVIESYAQNPELLQLMEQSGVKINIGEAEKQRITMLGIPNSEKIVVPIKQGQNDQQQPQMSPEMIQQLVQQTVEQAMQAKPENDPLVGIFDKLPEDVKQQLLQKYGYQSVETSPTEKTLELKAADQATKSHQDTVKTAMDVMKTAHQQTLATHSAALPAVPPEEKKEKVNA